LRNVTLNKSNDKGDINMKLNMDDLRQFIRREIEAVMKQKKQTESNPYHGMKGTPDAGKFVSKDSDGSYADGDEQYKYRSGKKSSKTFPCGRKDPSRKRTCSKGVISDEQQGAR
jgi:hypothetical protein